MVCTNFEGDTNIIQKQFATKTIPHGSEKSYCEKISEMNTTLLTSNADIENLQELKWLSVVSVS